MNYFRFIKEFFEKYSPFLKELHSKQDWFVSTRQIADFLNCIDIDYYIYNFDPIRIDIGPEFYPYFEVKVSPEFITICIKIIKPHGRNKKILYGNTPGFLYFPEIEMVKVLVEDCSKFGLDIFEVCDDMEIDLELLDDTKIMELTLECPISSKNDSLNYLL